MKVMLRGREWTIQELVMVALAGYVTLFIAIGATIFLLIFMIWFGATLYELLPMLNPVI